MVFPIYDVLRHYDSRLRVAKSVQQKEFQLSEASLKTKPLLRLTLSSL